jgi:hypothetical protein
MRNMSLLLQVYTTAILNRVLNCNHKSGSINRIRSFREYSTNFGTRVRFDSNSNRANSNCSFRIRIRIRRIVHSFSKFGFAEYSRVRIRIRIGRIFPHPCATLGGERTPRLLGEALHADRPNEVIHFDNVYMHKGETSHSYRLIIKDDFSGYIWLHPMEIADAANTVDALMK